MSEGIAQMHPMTNTHILVQEFAYLEPSSVQSALSLLEEYGDRAQVLAGGTYLLVQMKMERQAPEYIINIQKLPGLEGSAVEDGGLRLGPCTAIYAIRHTPEIQRDFTALAEACAAFGSTQIQMMGTIGGNLCNGSPASDTVPALMAFDGQLTLTSRDGERVISVEEFVLSPGQTDLRPGELLTSLRLPRPQPGSGSAFVKISRVAADLAKASAAAVLVLDGERVADCRLAFGSVAPTVVRAREAEALLIGRVFSQELALEAGAVASQEISPIDDVRSTAWYRREVLKAVTHDVLCVARERAQGRMGRWAGRQAGKWTRDRTSAAREETHGIFRVARDAQHLIELTVNGEEHRLWVAANELLLTVLRERLELTGTKYGCGIGECGACTVHVNGEPALACLTLAIAVDGAEVLTVEGLRGVKGELHPLQDAFIEHQAFQCGYCTPGMLMMSRRMLDEIPSPGEDDVRDYLRGNRCRCTGFASIVRAVLSCTREYTDSARGE